MLSVGRVLAEDVKVTPYFLPSDQAFWGSPFSLLFTRVYGKGKFSELRLEGTLPSPVIERLGKVTVSVAESGTVVGVGASRHTCGGCACVYLLFLLRRKNCRLDLASAPSKGPGRNAPALC
jgi:hypothetical protein